MKTIKDCVNCLYKKACIRLRERELADQWSETQKKHKEELRVSLDHQKQKIKEWLLKKLLYKSKLDNCYHTIGKKVDLKEFEELKQ